MDKSRGQSESGQHKAEAPLDFEKAVAQIEQIIERIESGQIGLEKSISEYERGAQLLKRCREALSKAEQRVEDLTAKMQADQAGTARAKSPSAGAAGDEPSDEESPF